jgi:hypothetical protein
MLQVEYPVVADALSSILPSGDDDPDQSGIEDWLERCWNHRSFEMGRPDFQITHSDQADPDV